jgi:regulator of PEP synthase PpsR (kinase-PPPase family)
MAVDALDQVIPEKVCIHVISDNTGSTAVRVLRGASVQFSKTAVEISVLQHVSNIDQIRAYLDREVSEGEETAVFHTIMSQKLRDAMRQLLDARDIPSVDVLGPATMVLSSVLNEEPARAVGLTLDDGVEPRYTEASEL